MSLSFGVFDHLDASGAPLRDFYEDRLRLVELYDRLGFYCYHVAEHHSTPLGMAPSPSVFLSAVAQRTDRINFGPLVYTLPLYHPIRLIEEICMLDQMSGGRFQFGTGKGISPIETRYYGVDPDNSSKMMIEAFEVLMRGLQNRTLDFDGQFYNFRNVPMEVAPLQKPHPPLWYGATLPQSAERPAATGMSIVTNAPAAAARTAGARGRGRAASGGARMAAPGRRVGRELCALPHGVRRPDVRGVAPLDRTVRRARHAAAAREAADRGRIGIAAAIGFYAVFISCGRSSPRFFMTCGVSTSAAHPQATAQHA